MFKHKAFTLIELLVVISIISLLSAIGAASLNQTRAKARDARKLSDIKAIQQALELYADQFNTYPPNTSATAYLCSYNAGSPDSYMPTGLAALVTNGYLQQIPCDPRATCTGGQCTMAAGVPPYRYVRRAGPGAGWGWTNTNCGTTPVGSVEYTLTFQSEKTAFSLPTFQTAAVGALSCAPGADCCISGPPL
ncbi:MAG TPA: prepilin-type N-terminal cleavage/methylation domain-containing protein [Patescibacteria group bacterium]|nr:prepilin-type N-terminal cleavage/methylation domain-containing protein [Patescibacteria group bacterium]